MKKLIPLFLAMFLLLNPMAGFAQGGFSDDMKQAGEALGDFFSDFGASMGAFSEDLKNYLENSEDVAKLKDKGWQALLELEAYLKSGNVGDDIKTAYETLLEKLSSIDVDAIKQKAQAAGQSFADYWASLRATVPQDVGAIVASDMSDAEKRRALDIYGNLAVPVLLSMDLPEAQAAFANAYAKQKLGLETDAELVQWTRDHKDEIEQVIAYLQP